LFGAEILTTVALLAIAIGDRQHRAPVLTAAPRRGL
jgi:hypothetical protein